MLEQPCPASDPHKGEAIIRSERVRRPRGSVVNVVNRIRADIFEGRMTPGHRLVESELTSALNVSRSTIREALNRLVAEGLVQIEPNRGAWVRRTSRQAMRQMFAVRELLEGQAAREMAEKAPGSPQAIARLRHIRAIEAALDLKADALAFMAANKEFHTAVLELSGNEVLQHLVPQLQFPQFRAAFFCFFSPRISEQSMVDHLAIIDAAIEGDPDRAQDAMRAHVRGTANLVLTMGDEFFAP